MTPERLARIKWLIQSAAGPRELAGMRWGFDQQGELTEEVVEAIEAEAKARRWKLPQYGR